MLKVNLHTIDIVKRFVKIVNECTQCDISLHSGRYIVDAKSIMGIFSLDITKPIELTIETDDENIKSDIIEKIKQFLV